MKNLGKALLKGAKTAVIGYCAYKLIDAAIKNKKEKEPEEYIPFDEIPVEEPKKDDKVKKAVMIAGGAAVVAIMYKINKLEIHARYTDEQMCKNYDMDIMNFAMNVFNMQGMPAENKRKHLFDLQDKLFYDDSKEIIRELIMEVK